MTRRYTSPTIDRSTVILVQEILKFAMAYIMLLLSTRGTTTGTPTASQVLSSWKLSTWLSVALLPATLYAIQNMAALLAYQNLDALTFNVLNQTKTLSAALCCYVIMGKPQSGIQILALLLLLVAALVMEGILNLQQVTWLLVWRKTSGDGGIFPSFSWDWGEGQQHFTQGVAPILLASFLSGLAGALSQKHLQQGEDSSRNPYLFSMELCAASILILVLNIAISSPDMILGKSSSFWDGWTLSTLIPIVSNSSGGILVGLVTKYAGSVQKGFALILGIFLSGVIQAVYSDQSIRSEQIVGGILAAASLYLHATYPPTKKVKEA